MLEAFELIGSIVETLASIVETLDFFGWIAELAGKVVRWVRGDRHE